MPYLLSEREPSEIDRFLKYVRDGQVVAWCFFDEMYHADVAAWFGLGEDLRTDEYSLRKRLVDDAGEMKLLIDRKNGIYYSLRQGSGSCVIRDSDLDEVLKMTCAGFSEITKRGAANLIPCFGKVFIDGSVGIKISS